jgi:hypothetical protein
MGEPQKKYDRSQEQEQGQANLQGQLQGQGQGQGQGQAQLAVQSLDSKSDNNNNSNDTKNRLDNSVDNKTSNKTDNSTDNKVDNSLDNKVSNSVENNVENTVDTKVNVDVNLDLHATGLSSPVIDLHGFGANDALVMPEVVNQTLNGGGNMFHLDQVNSLIGDTKIDGVTVSYNGSSSYDPTAGFSMDAKVAGGDSKIDDTHLGSAVGAGAGVVSHADAALTQSAFTQTVTTGANIQFNSATIQAAGHDLTDDHHTL